MLNIFEKSALLFRLIASVSVFNITLQEICGGNIPPQQASFALFNCLHPQEQFHLFGEPALVGRQISSCGPFMALQMLILGGFLFLYQG